MIPDSRHKQEMVRDDKGRFVKGVSGNPKGRSPKEREERYYEIAMSAVTFKDWEEIISTAVKQAKRGDSMARKWLSDYLAPQSQRHEVTGADGGPIIVNWDDDNDSG